MAQEPRLAISVANPRVAAKQWIPDMTLILTYAADEFVLQLSDRRLTGPDGGVVDDGANKATLVCDCCLIAYSGLAQIGKERTDLWLTKVLAKNNCRCMSDAMRILEREATKTFRSLRLHPKYKRTVFVGGGYARLKDDVLPRPAMFTVSNALVSDGSGWLQTASESFTSRVTIKPQSLPFLLVANGRALPGGSLNDLSRMMRRLSARGIGPAAALRTLVVAFRSASAADRAVGKDLLGCCLPRRYVERQKTTLIAVASTPDWNCPTFWYMPKERGDWIQYGPNFICGDSAASNFRATAI